MKKADTRTFPDTRLTQLANRIFMGMAPPGQFRQSDARQALTGLFTEKKGMGGSRRFVEIASLGAGEDFGVVESQLDNLVYFFQEFIAKPRPFAFIILVGTPHLFPGKGVEAEGKFRHWIWRKQLLLPS